MKKDYASALREYKKAIEKNDKIKYVYQNIGVIFQKQFKYNDAIQNYELELKNNPENEGVRRALIAIKEYRRQLEIYKKLSFIIKEGNEYIKINNAFFKAINTMQKNGFQKEKLEAYLQDSKDSLYKHRDEIKKFNTEDKSIKEIQLLLEDAFNKKIGGIDYFFKNEPQLVRMQQVNFDMIKEADTIFINAYKNINDILNNMKMINSKELKKNIRSTFIYFKELEHIYDIKKP